MKKQILLYESGNELAAYAAKQINYHVMGYYPITPSTQIAELLDAMRANGEHQISMIPAEGEHSAAGICYGASAGGGRVFNATSANGLLYALEQFPVQSGTRFPMVMNVACRTVSGPLSIKGDHSDIMYLLNTGWIILFANTPQEIYDFNLCALKIAERVKLPVAIAFDGFFTSHQKNKCLVFEEDETVRQFVGKAAPAYDILDMEKPVTIGSYMNEPDIINNKYQLHLAMEEARNVSYEIFEEYEALSGRNYTVLESCGTEDAETILFFLGSAYQTAKMAADILREQGERVGVMTIHMLRPFPKQQIQECCKQAETILIAERQDSYGAGGGNMSLEIKAALQEIGCSARVITRIYGLGGKDFYVEDAQQMFSETQQKDCEAFAYYGIYEGDQEKEIPQYMPVIKEKEAVSGAIEVNFEEETGRYVVNVKRLADTTRMPKRLAPGHGACPGCGIPVNVNLLLKGIEGNVVLLFQTGCGMVVTTPYPKTAFRVPYIHNLFQNGAATLSGLVEMCEERQKRGEYPKGDITFIMISGDGGMDIGMGSAIGAALRNHSMIIMEYDNGGYMNTGYQLSYATPYGAKSATSHIGKEQFGKQFFHKDTPQIMAATYIPYVATAAESNPVDFIKKAAKAKAYAKKYGLVYLKALSACPLNWGDKPDEERKVIEAAVDSCFFPLYEVERGITKLNYNPESKGKKIPVLDFFKLMGRTKHLVKEEYQETLQQLQQEIDRRWERLKAMEADPLL